MVSIIYMVHKLVFIGKEIEQHVHIHQNHDLHHDIIMNFHNARNVENIKLMDI